MRDFAATHMSANGTKLLNARALVCPEELAKADMGPFRRDSAFDPKAPLGRSQSRTAASPDLMLANPLCCLSG
jgi:hypothetical protein